MSFSIVTDTSANLPTPWLEENDVSVIPFHYTINGREMACLDTVTPKGMLKAAEYVEAVQSRQGYYISCIEEIAYRRGFSGAEKLYELGSALRKTEYGEYLMGVAREGLA